MIQNLETYERELALRDMKASQDMIHLLKDGLEKFEDLEKGIWQMANCRVEIIRLKSDKEG